MKITDLKCLADFSASNAGGLVTHDVSPAYIRSAAAMLADIAAEQEHTAAYIYSGKSITVQASNRKKCILWQVRLTADIPTPPDQTIWANRTRADAFVRVCQARIGTMHGASSEFLEALVHFLGKWIEAIRHEQEIRARKTQSESIES